MSERRPFWRARLLPVFLALVGLNVLVLAAWTGPRYWRQRNAAARAEAAEREAARLRASVEDLRERATAIRENGVDTGRFYESVVGPERTELLPILEAIEALARSPGLRPGARQLRREEVPDAPLQRVAVTLPLEGSYEQLVRFLGEVERSPRFLTVERVALRADPEGGATLQVELSAYLRAEPGEGDGRPRGRT